jgi:cytochrome c-type biogenesis protein CcmH
VTGFVIAALLLALLAALFVAWPLLRRRAGAPAAPIAAALVGLLLVFASALLYLTLGNRGWIGAAPANDPGANIAALALHLEADPSDQSGWMSLGAAYTEFGQFALALRAYERANRLSPGGNADALAGMGEALLLSGDEARAAQAAEFIERALQLDGNTPKALFYGAIIAYRQGRLDVARARFVAMLALSPPDNVRAALQKEIADIDAKQHPRVDAATAVHLHLQLAPALAARVPANASLFVFVRAPNGGPPLAAKRIDATLPQDVELSAADSMIAGRGLTPGQNVSVVARISASGSPQGSSGDLFGQIDYVAGKSGTRALEIDQVMQGGAAAPAAAADAPVAGPDASTAIHLHVTLAPALAARVPANASLFVFVRAPNGGPPLAAKRIGASLPQDVELSAADSMIAGRGLTPGQNVSVVARISASGSPQASSGDLYGQIDTVAGKSGARALEIDKLSP